MFPTRIIIFVLSCLVIVNMIVFMEHFSDAVIEKHFQTSDIPNYK